MPDPVRQTLGLLPALLLAMLLLISLPARADTVYVYAAASLTDVMQQLIARYQKQESGHIVPVVAASSVLARQIANGAPAQIYISANVRWMDWLEDQGIPLQGRQDLARNRLALIAPQNSDSRFTPQAPPWPLDTLLGNGERLAVANPDHVPAGIYARQALEAQGLWERLSPRMARAENVRAALALVERGEAPLGIVYQTDALISPRVRILQLFPAEDHAPIRYPIASIGKQIPAEVSRFRKWLTGPEAAVILADRGFLPATGLH